MKIMPPTPSTTDDTTMDDLYEMQRLDSLPDKLRELAARHVQDQFDAVPSFFDRFKDGKAED